jgi:hypothetical protein
MKNWESDFKNYSNDLIELIERENILNTREKELMNKRTAHNYSYKLFNIQSSIYNLQRLILENDELSTSSYSTNSLPLQLPIKDRKLMKLLESTLVCNLITFVIIIMRDN